MSVRTLRLAALPCQSGRSRAAGGFIPAQLPALQLFCRSVVAFFDARRGVGHDGGQRQSQRQYLVIADGGGDKPLWYCHAARARGRRGATAGQPGAGARRLYAKTDRYFWYLSVARLPACGAACVPGCTCKPPCHALGLVCLPCKMDYASYTYPFVSQKESKNDDS